MLLGTMTCVRWKVSISVARMLMRRTKPSWPATDHPVARLDRPLDQQDDAGDHVVGDVLQAEADADRQRAQHDGEVGEVDAERADADQDGDDDADIVQAGVDRLAQRHRRVDGRQHAVAHHRAHQAGEQHADAEGHDRHADIAERDRDAADLHAVHQLADAASGWRRCRRSRPRECRPRAAATRNRSNTSITQVLAAQGRVGRQAEAMAHPRPVGVSGAAASSSRSAIRRCASSAIAINRHVAADRVVQMARPAWRSPAGRRRSTTAPRRSAAAGATDHQVPPIMRGAVRRPAGPVRRARRGCRAPAGRAARSTVASTRAPTEAQRAAVSAAAGSAPT